MYTEPLAIAKDDTLDILENRPVREKKNTRRRFSTVAVSQLLENTQKPVQQVIDWDNFVTIASIPQYYPRAIREALEIQREEVGNSSKIIENRQGPVCYYGNMEATLEKVRYTEGQIQSTSI